MSLLEYQDFDEIFRFSFFLGWWCRQGTGGSQLIKNQYGGIRSAPFQPFCAQQKGEIEFLSGIFSRLQVVDLQRSVGMTALRTKVLIEPKSITRKKPRSIASNQEVLYDFFLCFT